MSIFSSIRVFKPRRNVFDLSHEVKLSCNFGQLIPFFCQDVVPGDTFKMRTESLVRMAPMLAPLMHRVNVYVHFFFVPNRLIWDEWETFITGGEDGTEEPVFPTSYFTSGNLEVGKLADYLGYPSPSNGYKASVLPFRAYDLIWNEYYRDQNLQDEVPISKASGDDDVTYKEILYRCWEKDYFTSALPWTQRGGDVHLPLNGDAPVELVPNSGRQRLMGLNGVALGTTSGMQTNVNGEPESQNPAYAWNLDPNGTLKTDLSVASGATINELRRATQLQAWLERNARGGSRYIEQIFSHFGVKSSDARLQRPEFLGGGKTPIMISEVLQTSETTENSPQANMSGHGISYGTSNNFKRWFEEHGIVMGIMSIMPRSGYQQGLPRQYQKFDKFDFYFPEFAHLGEQPVYNSELYLKDSKVGEESGVFGYQSRYAEYKYIPNSSHGEFKTTLNYWHLDRIFGSNPTLSGSFVECNPQTNDLNRIFAVPEAKDHFYVQLYNQVKAIRPMPKFGTPRL